MVYLANAFSNTTTVIDGNTDSVVKNVKVGTGPTSIAVNPTTNMVYVANEDSKTVSVIDGNNNTNSVVNTIAIKNTWP